MANRYWEPLKDEHCDCLDRVLQSTVEVAACLQKCRRAGLPVDEQIAVVEQHSQLAAALKREFFPTRP